MAGLVFFIVNLILLKNVLGGDVFFPVHDGTWFVRLQQFDRAIKLGQFPPRLAPDMAFGFGYPIFKYYAPLFIFISWLIFKTVGSYSLAIMSTVFLSSFVGILGMFFLAKNFWGFWGGVLSAIAFLFLPYRALDIYVRGAFAELLAINILPFLFYFFFKVVNAPGRVKKGDMAGLVLSAFFFILSHNLYLLIFGLLSPLFLIYLAMKNRGDRDDKGDRERERLRILIGGTLLALLLSSFYWLPMILGIKDINVIHQAEKTHFANHFVYLRQIWNSSWGFGGSAPGLEDGMSFKAGKLQIILALIGLVLAVWKRKKRKEILLLASLGIVSLSLSLPLSKIFWKNVPLLPIVQFPWRFLGVFGLIIAFFSGGVVGFKGNHFSKLAIVTIVAGGLIFLNLKYFTPQKIIADAADHFITNEKIAKDSALQIAEYFPKDVTKIPRAKPKSALEIASGRSADVVLDSPFKIIFRLDAPAKVVVNRFYFPGWQAKYKNKLLKIGPNDIDGRIAFSVDRAGEYTLTLVSTPVEKISWGLSFFAVFVLFLFLVY